MRMLTIKMSDELSELIDEIRQSHGYSDIGDFVRDAFQCYTGLLIHQEKGNTVIVRYKNGEELPVFDIFEEIIQ